MAAVAASSSGRFSSASRSRSAREGSRVEQLLKSGSDDRGVVDHIYLATVSRHPSEAELAVGLQALEADRKRGAENLQWALINSPEFIFNY